MDFATLKAQVGNMLNRGSDAWGTGASDERLIALNMAKDWAQRQYNFEFARTTVQVTMAQNGVDLSTAVESSDGVTPVVVKTIEKGYLPNGIPVDIMTWNTRRERAQRYGRTLGDVSLNTASQYTRVQELTFSRRGDLVIFNNYDTNLLGTSFLFEMDVVKWMPAYNDYATDPADKVESDFFLTYCHDWLLWSAVTQLNLFVKEEERFNVNSHVLSSSWQSVQTWNAQVMQQETDDVSLD